MRRRHMRLADGRVIRFPAIMGILNVTPDSFHDSGRYFDHARAVAHGIEMAAAGAGIIDVGGESTRPGAMEIDAEEESRRVIPVIRALVKRLKIPVSADTRRAVVARAALGEGAAIINDVSALTFDPAMIAVAKNGRAAVVLMHMRGTPATMARMARYGDVVEEVCGYLAARAEAVIRAGIARSRIIIDPGFGFAKRPRHNLKLLAGISQIAALGYPVLLGFSGKTIAVHADGERARIARNAAAEMLALAGGASIIRVHDPGLTAAVIRVASQMGAGSLPA
ncbi:MAG: dihydropteroate synthase [Candidatus Binataceae bacterium]